MIYAMKILLGRGRVLYESLFGCIRNSW